MSEEAQTMSTDKQKPMISLVKEKMPPDMSYRDTTWTANKTRNLAEAFYMTSKDSTDLHAGLEAGEVYEMNLDLRIKLDIKIIATGNSSDVIDLGGLGTITGCRKATPEEVESQKFGTR